LKKSIKVPSLYIITGANGAGKSLNGPSLLPVKLRDNIFDGDKVFVEKRNQY
jgi:predicted ATPase